MTSASEMQALLRLLTWLSPAFPVGGFAYSGGLERAVHDCQVRDAAGLQVWIGALMAHGTIRTDGVLLAEAFCQVDDEAGLADVAALASALAGSSERHQETTLLGEAFVTASRAWPHPLFDRLPRACAYPVAVGAVAAAHAVPLENALTAFLHAAASQLVSAGIRLSVSGQRDGVAIMAGLEEIIADSAASIKNSTLDDLGSFTILADIASLRHETQPSRIFRS
jgi:urease accessory protein